MNTGTTTRGDFNSERDNLQNRPPSPLPIAAPSAQTLKPLQPTQPPAPHQQREESGLTGSGGDHLNALLPKKSGIGDLAERGGDHFSESRVTRQGRKRGIAGPHRLSEFL